MSKSEKASLTLRFLELKQGKSSVSNYISSFESHPSTDSNLSALHIEKISDLFLVWRYTWWNLLCSSLSYLSKSLLIQCFTLKTSRRKGIVWWGRGSQEPKQMETSLPSISIFFKKKKKHLASRFHSGASHRSHKSCFNYGSYEQFIRECSKPIVYCSCKQEGHWSSKCPNYYEGPYSRKLIVMDASSGSS